ncbi:MAG: right-handed parallel beta-helix repeat-containing protein [Janthinobacterium lividum]
MMHRLPFFISCLLFGGANGLATLATAQATATALYVNDASTSGDIYTSAAGSDATGTGSTSAPFATVARALTQADPTTQTIFIDAGTYTEHVVLTKTVSLRGAGTATAHPTSSTVFDGGLLPASTQTNETGLLLPLSGGTSSSPLTIAGLTFQAYDFGIQTTGVPQAYVLLEDVETVHNRRQGIMWNSLSGVQHLTLRRVRAAYTAEGANTTANGAGRGLFLVNGTKADILIEDGVFEFNRRNGVDVNDGSVSGLTVRNCQFTQNTGGALAVLGAGGARDSNGNFTSFAALLEGNTIRNNASNGMELKACTGTGRASGAGSFVVRGNFIARTIGASTGLVDDNAGIAFIDRDRNVIAVGGGVTGDLTTGGAFVQGNTIRGYLADATSSGNNINGFGLVLEGAQNKVFGNVVAQCQRGIQVQDRPTNSTGLTPFFDISRNGLVVSAGDSIRGNRLDSCTTAIRAVNLTNPVDASVNWLGATNAAAVRGTGGLVQTLGGPATNFAEVPSLAPTGQLDYSPFLNSRADASTAAGFQPLLDYLHVDAGSPRSAPAAPLAEGLALVPESGTLSLVAGNYDETISLAKNLTLTTAGSATLRDLALNGSGKVLTLGAPLTVTNTLTLTSGLVRTTAAAVLSLANQATATSGNAASYIDGPLRKVGQQAFVFPLGKNGQWARLGISAPASATTAFTAEYVAATYPTRTAAAPLSEVSEVEYWTLDGAGTTDAVSVSLFWEDAFRSGIDDFSTDLQVASFTGSQWQTLGNGGLSGSLSAGAVGSAQAVSSFGAFTLGSLSPTVNPLSPQLGSFTANQPRPNAVDLRWTLPSETNTYGYAVERSANAAAWQQIGFVASQGLSAQARTYTYQDPTVQGLAQAAYRLRQTTPTGAARYSEVAAVNLASSPLATTTATTADFALFPNPASHQVTLRLPASASGPAEAVLTDLSGRKVLHQTLHSGSDATLLLPDSLGTGVYLLQVRGAGLPAKPHRLVVQ